MSLFTQHKKRSLGVGLLIAVGAVGAALIFRRLQAQPWEAYQAQVARFEARKAAIDAAYWERRIQMGAVRVAPDPEKPNDTVNVAEAEVRLVELERKVVAKREDVERAQRELEQARAKADEAAGELSRLERGTGETQRLELARRASAEASARFAEAGKREDALLGDYRRLKSAIAEAKAPLTQSLEVANARVKPRAASVVTYDQTRDRCQSCHAAADRCGLSRPHEVLSALDAPKASAAQVLQRYCVNPEMAEGYRRTSDELCRRELVAPVGAKEGHCLEQREREVLLAVADNYCRPASDVSKALRAGAVCVSAEAWQTLARYASPPNACVLALADEGELCLEGAQRDVALAWFSERCPELSTTVTGLREHSRACASGKEAKTLAETRPLAFTLPAWAQTHPFRSELLGTRHPVERFGCGSCHEGRDTAAHPVAARVEKRGQLDQAACAKCHTEEVHLAFAEQYAKGRRLFAELGCQGCHEVDALRDFPKIGPALTGLKAKTRPEFLAEWISHPRAVRARTRMPSFWPEAGERSDEVRKIVAYLWLRSDDAKLPAPPKGDVARGKALVEGIGCRGCHSFSAPERLCSEHSTPGSCEAPRSLSASGARDFAPNLANAGNELNAAWIFAWVKNPSAIWPGTRMPNLRLTDAEAADVTAYLLTLKSEKRTASREENARAASSSPESAASFDTATAEAGSRLIAHYGCAGCHDIPGHERDARVGRSLDGFGDRAPARAQEWLRATELKLAEAHAHPRNGAPSSAAQYELDAGELEPLVVFLRSRVPTRVPAQLRTDADARRSASARGAQLIDYFNCRGCHVIDGEGGAIRDLFAPDSLYLAPPVLQREGWRVQPHWLSAFLKDPSVPLRPWLEVRMPTFPFGEERIDSLVKGFAAAAPEAPSGAPRELSGSERTEAKALFTQLQCSACHIQGTLRPGQDPASAAPALSLAKHRLRADWLAAWLAEPQSLQEGTRMPSFFTADTPDAVLYPEFFGGSQEKQIQALRDYVMTLPDADPPAQKRR